MDLKIDDFVEIQSMKVYNTFEALDILNTSQRVEEDIDAEYEYVT